MLLACGGSGDEGGNLYTQGDGVDGIESTAGDGDGDPSTGDGDGEPTGDGDPSTGDGDPTGGVKLDTLPPDSVDDGPMDEGCSFVDLLFVIDNSVSMGGYQAAL
ncbi:MAG TPA: hypothetical protein VK034_19480, partial [Enhygromyxa sp.]|nr:hypothetical protein [Enhygromyxa sp.]